MLHEKSFTGLIPEEPRPTDYIAGVSSPLVTSIVMPSGDWSNYPSRGEQQNIPFETFNCTAFSLTNTIETWLNYFIQSKQMPITHMQFLQAEGYLDDDGKVNISERALGSMAGTNENGNRLTTVIDAARKFGLASNKLWPFGGNNIKEYYQTPPDVVSQQAGMFLNYFQINYEWFYNSPGTYVEAIKECPLWIALVTCNGWNNPPVQWCGVDGTNHAVELLKFDNQNNPLIADSYSPFTKSLALNYQIPYALKVFVSILNNNQPIINKETMKLVRDKGTVYLVAGVNKKIKTGIASQEVLDALFGDEPIVDGDTSDVKQSQTAATGFVIHKA